MIPASSVSLEIYSRGQVCIACHVYRVWKRFGQTSPYHAGLAGLPQDDSAVRHRLPHSRTLNTTKKLHMQLKPSPAHVEGRARSERSGQWEALPLPAWTMQLYRVWGSSVIVAIVGLHHDSMCCKEGPENARLLGARTCMSNHRGHALIPTSPPPPPRILLLLLAVAARLQGGRARFSGGQQQPAKGLRRFADCISPLMHLVIANQALHLGLPIHASLDADWVSCPGCTQYALPACRKGLHLQEQSPSLCLHRPWCLS